jgi:hypothetical protein
MAAKKTFYPLCLEYLDKHLDKDFHDLARATLPYYLPANILDLPTRAERRDAIESIPEDAVPSHTKELVKIGVQMLWKKEREKKNGIQRRFK